ncbi:lytic murein transglycosylase [Mesorhizobium helmanticense]|uniref:Lytic murein transglycosylase n=1 Tax=Mesorhizobium helmanticense TaxID=1776423 RepID=A0A2T4IQC3_9HYPH|nr:lytic murein transglycosylase [Mesorhizobium helmanticense]
MDRPHRRIRQRWRDSTPLCPAGHLPLKGGDRLSSRLSLSVADLSEAPKLPISPLEGETSGRTEGGAKE